VAEVDQVLSRRVLVETELTPKPVLPGPEIPQAIARETAPARLVIRLADTSGHRSDASFLVRKMYGWRGYHADPVHHDPNCVTLVASTAEKTLATITVGFDSPAGMAVGTLYPDHVARMKADGARLCEFTRLAVDRTEHSRELLAMMFHVAYMYARRLHQSTDLLIEVNPRHVRFYMRMLGFRRLGPERLCPRVNAPAVLMWLPLGYAEEQIALLGGQGDAAEGVRSLYPLFFSPHEEEGITARLQALDSRFLDTLPLF
jgi:hypothetical protein